MPYEFYKVLHLLGLFMAITGLAGFFLLTYNGGEVKKKTRQMALLIHGVGLAFALVSGFGLAARLGYMSGMPGWVYAKIAIWLTAGGLIVLVKKKAQWGWSLYSMIIGLFFLGALLAVNKPF